jgi:hypothetical protein
MPGPPRNAESDDRPGPRPRRPVRDSPRPSPLAQIRSWCPLLPLPQGVPPRTSTEGLLPLLPASRTWSMTYPNSDRHCLRRGGRSGGGAARPLFCQRPLRTILWNCCGPVRAIKHQGRLSQPRNGAKQNRDLFSLVRVARPTPCEGVREGLLETSDGGPSEQQRPLPGHGFATRGRHPGRLRLGLRRTTMTDILLRHYPELAPALSDIQNLFGPLTAERGRPPARSSPHGSGARRWKSAFVTVGVWRPGLSGRHLSVWPGVPVILWAANFGTK